MAKCNLGSEDMRDSAQSDVHRDGFTAIVLAGSRSNNCPVASVFGEQYKALVPIAGQPMVSRVVNALVQSSSITRIVIVFDCEDSLFSSCPEFKAVAKDIDIEVVSCGSSICDSVAKVIEATGAEWPYMVTTADHALLTPEMVDDFCVNAQRGGDIAVGLVEKKYLDEMHPGSKRTYLPFRETKLSGANLFAFTGPEAMRALVFWKSVEQQRKKPWKLFASFGWGNLFGLLLKRYTVDQAFARASKRLGLTAYAVRLPYAEAAIDVDSPKDYVQVSEILENRAAVFIPA
ncbi:MAG: NTP transferase domain-containing protein [Kordiimonas sp.]